MTVYDAAPVYRAFQGLHPHACVKLCCVRLCLPALVLQLYGATGCCPCLQGVLLFGPPGTGKTLIARQIGKMLNGKDPKVVNGPEILNK